MQAFLLTLNMITQELDDRREPGAFSLLSFKDRQATAAQLFVPEFALLVLKSPQALSDVRFRELWPRHPVEKVAQVLHRNPAPNGGAEEHFPLPLPFAPD